MEIAPHDMRFAIESESEAKEQKQKHYYHFSPFDTIIFLESCKLCAHRTNKSIQSHMRAYDTRMHESRECVVCCCFHLCYLCCCTNRSIDSYILQISMCVSASCKTIHTNTRTINLLPSHQFMIKFANRPLEINFNSIIGFSTRLMCLLGLLALCDKNESFNCVIWL